MCPCTVCYRNRLKCQRENRCIVIHLRLLTTAPGMACSHKTLNTIEQCSITDVCSEPEPVNHCCDVQPKQRRTLMFFHDAWARIDFEPERAHWTHTVCVRWHKHQQIMLVRRFWCKSRAARIYRIILIKCSCPALHKLGYRGIPVWLFLLYLWHQVCLFLI